MLFTSRREFLKLLALTGITSPLHNLLNPSLGFAQSAGGTGKNLIIINLKGGMDHLAAFPYYADPRYSGSDSRNIANYIRSVRPTVFTLPSTTLQMANDGNFNLAINNYMGFSPALAALKPIYEAGGMALVQGVGIQAGVSGNGSHDYAELVYSIGRRDFEGGSARGWYARLIDQLQMSSNQAFGFGTSGRIDFLTEDTARAPTVGSSTEALAWADPLSSARTNLNIRTARLLAQAANPSGTAQVKIRDSLMGAFDTASVMGTINTATNPGGAHALVGSYPTSGGIGPALRSVARMISYNNGDQRNRLYYALQEGYDHHGPQGGFAGTGTTSGPLHDRLSDFGLSLAALVTDLKNPACYNWDKTIIVVISEFGRTVKENGGEGTDHGHGRSVLVLGGPVQGGVFGNLPDQATLQSRNLVIPDIEFQNIIAPAVHWFGGNDEALFPRDSYQYRPEVGNMLISSM